MVTKAPPRDTPDLSGFQPNFDRWKAQIEAELKAAFLVAFQTSGADVPRSRMNELATQFALEHAGDLMSGGKYDLNAATLDYLKGLVAAAVEDGRTSQEIADALRHPDPDTGEDLIVFSPRRAKTIAVTETASALGQGQKAAAVEQGQDQKKWVTSGDEDVDDECQGNEDDGWIDVDDEFSSGDDTIPAHPSCRCDVIYRTKAVHQEAASGRLVWHGNSAPAVRDHHCPTCGRWVGRHNGTEGVGYCPQCKEAPIT